MSIPGLIFILLCVWWSEGISAAWNVLKGFGAAAIKAFEMLCMIAVQFHAELGLDDWITTHAIWCLIAFAAFAAGGYAFSKRQKKQVIGIISYSLSIASLLKAIRELGRK